MIDVYIDDVKDTRIVTIKEGFRIDFENKSKDEYLHLIVDEETFISLYYRLKARCEIENLISIDKTR